MATEEKRKKRKKRKKKSALKPILIVILIAVLIGAGIYVWNAFFREKDEYERYQFDTEAMEGRIAQMTEEEIQEELNRVVEEGMFNISIASSIVFDPKTGEGEARIENIAANHYHMQVDITLDDTGETVYSSKLIKPGYSIEKIKLDKKLAPGVYAATAVFSAITQEELQLMGRAGAQIRLFVPDQNGDIPGLATPEPTPEPTPAAN